MLLRRWAFMRFSHRMGNRFPECFFFYILSLVLPGQSRCQSVMSFCDKINICTYTAVCHTINSRFPHVLHWLVGLYILYSYYFERIAKTNFVLKIAMSLNSRHLAHVHNIFQQQFLQYIIQRKCDVF